MKTISKETLAEEVMDYVGDYADSHTIMMQEVDGCMVGISFTQNDGQVMHIAFKIADNNAKLMIFVPDCPFDVDIAFEEFKNLGISLCVKGRENEVLFISHQMTYKDIDENVSAAASETMVSMIEAMTEVINKSKMIK